MRVTGHDQQIAKLFLNKADKSEFKEIVDKIKQMDEDIEDLINSRDKMNTRMGRLEDRVSGYSGPRGKN